jgi:hypothetical protein
VSALLFFFLPGALCNVFYKVKSITGLYSNFKCPFAANSVNLNVGEAKVTAW